MLRNFRREIPTDMRDIKGQSLFSSRFLYNYESNNTLISYVAKKTKNVILLSNVHFDDAIPLLKNPKFKPEVIFDYNAHKSGVDKNNQMTKEFKAYRAIHRWPTVLFFDLIGQAALASWVLYNIKYPDNVLTVKKERRQFLYLLGSSLVLPAIVAREASESFKYCNKEFKNVLHSLTHPESSVSVEPKISEIIPTRRGPCYLCERGKDVKKRLVCSKCLKHVCTEHSKSYTFCDKCQDDFSIN